MSRNCFWFPELAGLFKTVSFVSVLTSFHRHGFNPRLGFIETTKSGAPPGVDVLDIKDLTPVSGFAVHHPMTNQKGTVVMHAGSEVSLLQIADLRPNMGAIPAVSFDSGVLIPQDVAKSPKRFLKVCGVCRQ